MRRALYFLVPITVILALILPGCYTVIVHPSDEGGYQARQTSDCLRCHADYHEYPYGYYYSPYPSYWWDYPGYGYYYAYPWWWSYYDYPYLDGDYTYDGVSARQETKFDRREVRGSPAPPPHSIMENDFDDLRNTSPIRPGLYTPPDGVSQDGASERTQPPGVDDSSSRTKDEPSDKSETKPTRNTRPAPKTDQKAGPDTSRQDKPPAEEPKDSDKKKKSRRGGGGR